MKLVTSSLGQAGDDGIEVTMLAPQLMKLAQQGVSVGKHVSVLSCAARQCHAAHTGFCLGLRPRAYYGPIAHTRAAERQEGCLKLLSRLESLKDRHTALEVRIADEDHRPRPDSGALAKLKVEKLRLKEEITRIAAR